MSPTATVEPTFDRLMRAHAAAVLAYCLRRTSHADAHDAAAETFAIAWRRLEHVPTGEDARYWLLGVARRVLANQDRSRRRRLRLRERLRGLAGGDTPTPETVILRNAEHQQVVDTVNRLAPNDREVLLLIVWDEIPRERVATMLEISIESVNKRYQRALRRLERALDTENRGSDTTPSPTREERREP